MLANTIYPPLDLRGSMGPTQEEQQIQDSNKGNNYEALHSRKVLQNNLGYIYFIVKF